MFKAAAFAGVLAGLALIQTLNPARPDLEKEKPIWITQNISDP